MPTVLIRDVIESDLPIFFEQQLDPLANDMAGFPARDRETFMAHWARNLRNASGIHKTIIYADQVAGNIVSWEQDGRRELGYWLGREFWGKGIATQALRAFLEIVTVRPLYAHVVKHNIASIRVLEKCGFKISGEEGEEVVLIQRE